MENGGEMDDVRVQVNEELMDAQAARIDDLERRLEALVALLKRDSVCKAIGLYPFDFDRANPNDLTLKLRPLKYSNERHRILEARLHKEVLTHLSRVSPARLAELLREQ